MAEREPSGPFCFDSVHYPAPADLEESAPVVRPRIRRRVPPTYAARGPEYQEPPSEP